MPSRNASRTRRTALPPAQFGEDAVAWAAWLYYSEGQTQERVARALGVSRASIANYLAEARARGLVRVSLDPDLLALGELSRLLEERFGLASAHVMPAEEGESEVSLRERLGRAGASVLQPRLRADTTLGVASGRTMLELARSLEDRRIEGLRVVQVSGSSLVDEEYSPETCTALIANRLGAHCENFHVPAVVSTRDMRDRLVREPGVARHLARIRTCDVVVFGAGELYDAVTFHDPHFLSPETVRDYIDRGAVSTVLGDFLDAAGRPVEGPLSGRMIALSLDDLKRAPARVCVAGGPRKRESIRAVLTGGYATSLVTDADTARYLTEPSHA